MENESPTKCVICGSEKTPLKRGLCQSHYNRFIAKLNQLEPDKQALFEEELIRMGKLLPRKKRGKPAVNDLFEQVAARLFGEQVEESEVGKLAKKANERLREFNESSVHPEITPEEWVASRKKSQKPEKTQEKLERKRKSGS